MTKLIVVEDKQFLKLQLIPVRQKGKQFYISIVPAKYLLEIYTVEPAEYDINRESAIANSFKDDEEYFDYLVNEDKKRIDTKAFERKESINRIKEIKKFLEDEEYALFPNTIIVTCDLINDIYDVPDYLEFEGLFKLQNFNISEIGNLAYLEKRQGEYFLYIPYQSNSVLVIDGQHRLKGLKEADESIKDNYELLVAFILQFDRPIVAKLFYTINYTQKSVNKSLLYHLSGEFSREIDIITFWHEAVKILNEVKHSPFYRRIRMLGIIPQNLSQGEKELMTLSQAFLIDYLKETTSEYAKKSIHQPIFLYYYKNRDLQIEIIRFLIKYFKAVAEIMKEEWNSPKTSIISKTIGVGALIKVLHFLFIMILFDEFNGDLHEIMKVNKEFLISKLDGIKNVDFSTTGAYGGVSGAGSINKLKKDMVENIKYFSAKNYEEFLKEYRESYLIRFKKLLENKRI